MKKNCSTDNETDVEKYDFRQYLKTTNGMDFHSDDSACGDLVGPN